MTVVGFDFGTTNSLISLVQGDRVILFLDHEGLPVPSVVFYEGTHTIVGRDAKERLGSAGLGVQGNVVRSPKMLLGRESVFVGGVERSPVDIVHDVVQYVLDQAIGTRSVRDLVIQKAVVTIPVNMDGPRRRALRDAFRMSGVGIVQFVHEPLAALYAHLRAAKNYEATLRKYDRQLMLVFDWGGGTLDLTLCRLIDGMLVQVVNDGTDEVGGDVFDETLRNEIELRVRRNRGLGEDIKIQPDAMTRLLHSCERAKIELSGRPRARLFVSNFYRHDTDPDLDYALTLEEMEDIFSTLLDKGLARIDRLLTQNNYSPASVSLCLAAGGMANMPAIRSRLHELFGPERVHVAEGSMTLISEGAAWIAHDEANLHLAKNVELLLARNSYMPLLKAGTELPREGEVRSEQFGLYCSDPRDGHAKFQLQAPNRPGPNVPANDRRTPLENLLVRVDKDAKAFFERLELNLEIDDNLILTASALSTVMRDHSEVEVHNLEFAVRLPNRPRGWLADDVEFESSDDGTHKSDGMVVMRSNIADTMNEKMIPGELFYKYDPRAFDPEYGRRSELQDKEHLYYQPCAICGRSSNDPLCHCASIARSGGDFANHRPD